MERQRIYNQQATANPNLNIRQAQIPNAPQVEGAGYGLLRAVGNAGGEIVRLVARDYAREWQGRVDDAVLRTNAEFERWKTEYMQTRQGADALTAQEDFANKYAELSRQAVAEFGNQRGNEVYRAGLERELTKYGLYAVKAGGTYQIQQDEAWQKSQWDAQVSSFQKIVEGNPLDSDMLDMERETLIRSWRAKNPGLDDGAIRDKLQAMQANVRMNALIAHGDYENAARLLSNSDVDKNANGASSIDENTARTAVARENAARLLGNTDENKIENGSSYLDGSGERSTYGRNPGQAENRTSFLPGLSASEARRYAQMIANGRIRAQRGAKGRQIARAAQNIMSMAIKLEGDQREAAILEETENIADAASREEIRRIALLDLQWIRQKRAIDNDLLAKKLAAKGDSEMPSSFLADLYSADVDDACRDRAIALYLHKNGLLREDSEQDDGHGQI